MAQREQASHSFRENHRRFFCRSNIISCYNFHFYFPAQDKFLIVALKSKEKFKLLRYMLVFLNSFRMRFQNKGIKQTDHQRDRRFSDIYRGSSDSCDFAKKWPPYFGSKGKEKQGSRKSARKHFTFFLDANPFPAFHYRSRERAPPWRIGSVCTIFCFSPNIDEMSVANNVWINHCSFFTGSNCNFFSLFSRKDFPMKRNLLSKAYWKLAEEEEEEETTRDDNFYQLAGSSYL